MSSKLIESIKSVFTEPVVARFSTLLGEPETNINKAIHGATSMVATDLFHKAYTAGGVEKIDSLARQAVASDFFGQMHELNTGTGGLVPGSILLNKGSEFTRSLLSPHTEAVVNEIARFAGISVPSATFITGIVGFAALDATGRYIVNANADHAALSFWLKSQVPENATLVPAGLAVKPALGIQHYPWEKRVVARKNSTLYLVIVLIILAIAAVFIYKSCRSSDTAGQSPDTTASNPSASTPSTTAPASDSTTQVMLPNGKILNAWKGGTEDQLVAFLKDPDAKLDKKNGNWFNFTKIGFASNSASLLLESEQQLNNIVAILDAFPKAHIKIGGYTDNTGDSVANVRLSQQRANNIAAKLKELGAKSSQLAGAEGYGPRYPVADNGTPEGRAANRRMAINVKEK